MALRFMEGFDYGSPSQLILSGWNIPSSSNQGDIQIGAAYRRFQGGGVRFTGNISNGFINRGIAGLSNTIIFGIAVKIESTQWGLPRIFWYDANVSEIGYVRFTTGDVGYFRTGEVQVASYATVNTINEWNYFEFKITSSPTTGSVVIRKNNALLGESYNVNTGNGNAFNRVSINGFRSATWFDDFYVCDSSGTVNNDFLGDCTVVKLNPAGPGDLTQFTTVSGENWEKVNENNSLDGDTSYIVAENANTTDLFVVDPMEFTPSSIKGLMVQNSFRKDKNSLAQVRSVLKYDGNITVGANAVASTSYSGSELIIESNTTTGLPWAPEDLANIQIGVERTL